MNDANGDWEPVPVAGASQSLFEAASGARYRVMLWTPPGTPPAGGWPVIYVLDANALFASLVETLRRSSRRPDATGVSPAAVVGVAHAEEALFATECRYRDYTFGASLRVSASGAGGGAAFQTFLIDQLAPHLNETWPLDPSRQVLFGHSLAGYFVLHTMLARPSAFATYAAISPSIWWDEAGLQASLTASAVRDVNAFVAVGEWESTLPPWQRDAPGHERLVERRRERRMLENARSFAEALSARLGTERVAFHCFPEEDHASVVMVAMQRTLRFALAPGSDQSR